MFVLSTWGVSLAQQQTLLQDSSSGGGGVAPEDRLHHMFLRPYEAAAGDSSACKGDDDCLAHANAIKNLLCIADGCNGTNKTKGPTACIKKLLAGQPLSQQEGIADAICAVIKSPGPKTRQALLKYSSHSKEGDVMEFQAYISALKGSARDCEESIKNYVGPYGPQWNDKWYRAMSGCRILAKERTREQEEKDFSTWFGVKQGSDGCSSIVNTEMRNACSTPTATTPIPPAYGQG